MEAYVFPSGEALWVAMRSGLVPPDVQKSPAQVAIQRDGSLEISPSVQVGQRAKRALRAAGIEMRDASGRSNPVSCWAEALPPRRVGEPSGALSHVLFALSGRRTLLDVCGELLRLGCDRQELRMVAHPSLHGLVRVLEPPWYVLSRALDHLDGLTAFVPTPPGQERVWTEVGHSHPLEAALEPPDDTLLLIGGTGTWWRLPDGEWTDVDQLLVPAGLPVAKRLEPEPEAPRIEVHVSLSRTARPEAATIFVLDNGRRAVEALVQGTPEAQLENVLFVVTGGTVVLRARPGREANTGALPGQAYARVLDLPNLFAPVGYAIEPPLRRDRLRTWLAPDPDLVTWLEPVGPNPREARAYAGARASGRAHAVVDAGLEIPPNDSGTVSVIPPPRRDRTPEPVQPPVKAPDDWPKEQVGRCAFARFSVLEAAFRPLTEWVDYLIDDSGDTLLAWSRSATFDFEPFVALEDVEPSRPRQPEEEEEKRPRPRVRQREWNGTREPAGQTEAQKSSTPGLTIEVPQSPTETEAMLSREEAAFLELDAPAESPARRAAWVRLARMYSRLQRSRDAGMAWAHANWDAPEAESAALARQWAETSGVRFEALLELPTPNIEQTRGAVAHLLAAALEGSSAVSSRVAGWVGFLDRYGDDLDVRSFWLGRYAVSRLSGGDTLGLARARDRVLARLQSGLSLDRDVPRLLRAMGQSGAAGAGTDRALKVSGQLEALLRAFEETSRKRSAVEAPPLLTRAYVHLEFAWGFARLASAERARQLRDGALSALDRKDPVHGYLTRAFVVRVEQALEGAAPDTPLPPEVNGMLNGLEPYMRYKVDRLRQFSLVLEPQERLDPMGSFWRSSQNSGGEALAALRGMRDPAELFKAIQLRMAVAADPQLGIEERVRLIDGLMDFLPQLPESQAQPLLQRFLAMGEEVAPKHRACVLEDALKVAGHFGRAALVKQLVLQLGNAITEIGADGVGEVGTMLVAGVRSLRRVGLRDEARELLARASAVLKGEDPNTMRARLALASGFAYLGAVSQAQPIIDEVQARLGREAGLISADRLRLSRAVAQALSHAPTEVALPGLLRVAQQLPWITDNYNTNSHFCLSLVDFADALVLGHVGDDLTLNESTRRFLDEDEYLVRRRVHRDVGGET
jgi:cellulose synthase operon protein C